jgi:hypothetical protein
MAWLITCGISMCLCKQQFGLAMVQNDRVHCVPHVSDFSLIFSFLREACTRLREQSASSLYFSRRFTALKMWLQKLIFSSFCELPGYEGILLCAQGTSMCRLYMLPGAPALRGMCILSPSSQCRFLQAIECLGVWDNARGLRFRE